MRADFFGKCVEYKCSGLAGDNKILKNVSSGCKDDDADVIASELTDLFYHTLVALAHHQVDIREVYRKLDERRRQ